MNHELTETESKVVKDALDLYSRLLCGQLCELEWRTRLQKIGDKTLTPHQLDELGDTVKILKSQMFPNLDQNASYSIMSEEAPLKAKIAYNIYERI